MAGLTLNIVVLFSLILAVGMLVDDAIIVSEFAERRMSEGMKPREAYAFAASRMSGPVIAATLTRIAAFSPLLFWPGIVGQFMGYLPITLIATLSASLVAALIFTPTLGALIGKPHEVHHDAARARRPLHQDRPPRRSAIPGITILLAVALLIGVPIALRPGRQGRRVLPRTSSRTPASCSSMPAATSRSPRRTGWCARSRRASSTCRSCRRSTPAPATWARAAIRQRRHRGRHRPDPVRVRRLAGAAAGRRDHGRDPRARPPTSRASRSR